MLSPIAFDCVSVNTRDQVDPALAPLIHSSASIRAYSWCALNEELVRSGMLGRDPAEGDTGTLFTWERKLVSKKGGAGAAGLHLPEGPAPE